MPIYTVYCRLHAQRTTDYSTLAFPDFRSILSRVHYIKSSFYQELFYYSVDGWLVGAIMSSHLSRNRISDPGKCKPTDRTTTKNQNSKWNFSIQFRSMKLSVWQECKVEIFLKVGGRYFIVTDGFTKNINSREEWVGLLKKCQKLCSTTEINKIHSKEAK